jgi:hypothetical protein
MKPLNEAVIHLINEDVVNAKKLIENELYIRLGTLLEEKLKNYAPTIFTEKMADKDYDGDKEIETSEQEFLGSRDKAIKKSMKAKSMKESIEESDDDLLEEDAFIEELQALVESIENDIGEELTESEIEELANILMEESGPDEDEEEDFEEDFEEEDYEEEEKTK